MATIKIHDKEITLPRYSLSIMAQAAPFLDNLQETLATADVANMTAGEANRLVMDTAGFLSAGAVRVDPEMTFEKLCDSFTIADAQLLQGVVGQVLAELGISLAAGQAGDAPAAPEGAPLAEPIAVAAE